MNLSDKINVYGYNDNGTPDSDVLKVRDVREAVKELKESFAKLDWMTTYQMDDLLNKINEIFGAKLT